MATNTRPKQSLVGIELVRLIAYEGNRIFTTDRARELAATRRSEGYLRH